MPTARNEELIKKAKAKFEELGYKVTSFEFEMDDIFKNKGHSLREIGKPDLGAEKDGKVTIIEIVASQLKLTQLRDYQKMDLLILLFDCERINDIEVWGTNDL